MSHLSCIIDPNCTVPMFNEGFIGPQNLVKSHDRLNLTNQSQMAPNWLTNNGTNNPEFDANEALELVVVLASVVLIVNIIQMLVKVINFLFQISNHFVDQTLEGSPAEVKKRRRKTRKEFADNNRGIQIRMLGKNDAIANRKLKKSCDSFSKSHTNSERSSNGSDMMEYWITASREGPVWCHSRPKNMSLETRSTGSIRKMIGREIGQRDEKECEQELIREFDRKSEEKNGRLVEKSGQSLPQIPDKVQSGPSQCTAASATMEKSQYKRNTPSDTICKTESSSAYTRYYHPDKKRGMKKRVLAGKLKGKVARLKAGGDE